MGRVQIARGIELAPREHGARLRVQHLLDKVGKGESARGGVFDKIVGAFETDFGEGNVNDVVAAYESDTIADIRSPKLNKFHTANCSKRRAKKIGGDGGKLKVES